jgi:CRISPR/Cas system-associated endoribonuclease Cas2
MKIFFPIAVLLLLASCRSTRKISSSLGKKDSLMTIIDPRNSDSAQRVHRAFEKISTDRIQYTTFQAKMKMDYDDGKKAYKDLNVILRMKKDSIIWISVNALLGIEAIRAVITPDTVILANKIENTVQYRTFDYLKEVAKLPMDFSTLQDLIVGNKIFLDSNIVAYGEGDKVVSMTMLGEFFKNFSQFEPVSLTLIRSKLDDVDITRSRSADLSYQDYTEVNGGQKFANKRRISVSDKNKLDIDIDFKQVQFDIPLTYPFSVKNLKMK